MRKIKLFNLHTGEYEIEKTFGGKFLNFVYLTKIGRYLRPIFTSKLFSKIYSLKKKSSISIKEIESFINLYDIKNENFRPYKDSYKSFNDYFIRVFKDNIRNFETSKDSFSAFCEARYMVCDLLETRLFNIKDKKITLDVLLGNDELAQEFSDSYLLVARLAPVDYHHYHYPVDGRLISSYQIKGILDSVTPIATNFEGEVFLHNERVVNIFETCDFGKMVYIEVGALAIGKIINTHLEVSFKKGERKGYFEFGGSTVICLIKKDHIIFNKEILDNSKRGIETYIHLGTTIGHRRDK